MTKKYIELDYYEFPNEFELKDLSFSEGCKLLGLKESYFIYNEDVYNQKIFHDFNCECLIILDGEIEEKVLITFTITDDVGNKNLNEIKKLKGYWSYSQDINFKLDLKEEY